jgi:hypothetical protein
MTHPANQLSSTRGPRCRFVTINGRQCRLSVSDARSGLCYRHLGLAHANTPAPSSTPSDFEDLSPDLLPQASEFTSANDVKAFLARLVVLVAKGRISPRRAAVLAYITNQLLHTHRAIESETRFEQETNPQWPELGDLPRPPRDPYEGSDTIRMIRNISPASFDRSKDMPEKKLSSPSLPDPAPVGTG